MTQPNSLARRRIARRPPHRPRLAIIGAGRAGSALGTLLAARGWKISAVASRKTGSARILARRCGAEIVTSNPALASFAADAALIAVPDRELAAVVRSLLLAPAVRRKKWIALHTSGSIGAGALHSLRNKGWAVGSFHPLMTFPQRARELSHLAGVAFAIDGDFTARVLARDLAESLGGRVLTLPSSARPRYHLAACFASNYVVTLASEATSLLVEAGLTRKQAMAALLPLMRATIANLEDVGLPRALTGPVTRGDAETISMHTSLLKRAPESLRALHAELVRRTARLARSAGWLDSAGVRRIERALRA